MNESQRLRCLELAASLKIAPDGVILYAHIFSQFVMSGQLPTPGDDKSGDVGL